ncbi:MAG: hypothetical protein O3A10_01690 [Chloroflexi bacterium]|nr:hypothetical protein [Chloroflexota bacterium]MDA1145964.1 hypothetical protein [Chloroflexota bacterium]
MPQRIDLGIAVGPRGKRRVARDARWIAVLDVAEVWRIGEEWWREQPIRRTYFHVVVEGGRGVTVFRDELAVALGGHEAGGGWFEQHY